MAIKYGRNDGNAIEDCRISVQVSYFDCKPQRHGVIEKFERQLFYPLCLYDFVVKLLFL